MYRAKFLTRHPSKAHLMIAPEDASMSGEVLQQQEEKSEDKKEIEDEEREKMLNEENKKDDKDGTKQGGGDVVEKMRKVLEESATADGAGKKKIPIGGIRMPGFLRSRSREKTKDGESDVDEGRDLLQEPSNTAGTHSSSTEQPPRIPILKITNPFARKKMDDQGGEAGSETEASGDEESNKPGNRRSGILEAIRLPLVSVFPRSKLRSTKGEKDPELGAQQQAGLASMETLEDSSTTDQVKMNGEDGMENVKLDNNTTTDEKDPEKAEGESAEDWRERVQALSKFKIIVGGVITFLILLIIIVIIAVSGPRRDMTGSPVFNDKYVSAVTSCGLVEGLLEDGAFAFRGIPYAVPPVGERRWMPAKPMQSMEECWNGTLTVHNATPPCWQIYPNGTINGVEDCLTLDVFTPQVRYHSPMPVVVLIGAETLVGGSPGTLQASAKLARSRDVLFVRPNFRLGILGFLAAEPIKRSVHPPTSGNYGLSDIVAALQWVKLNIMHFGGDPDSITVLGHRAGGTLVTALTASRVAKGLFHRAWISSGSSIFPGMDLMESERNNAEYVSSLKCDGEDDVAACMRQKDVEDLLDLMPNHWGRPLHDLPHPDDKGAANRHQWLVLDGKILQQHIVDAWKEQGIRAKLVMGSTIHSDVPGKPVSDEEVEKLVRGSVLGTKGIADEALRRYGSNWTGLVAMTSDIRTVCPLLELARHVPVPFYLVTQARVLMPSGDLDTPPPPPLADVDADVDAILGWYEPRSSEQRRYVAAIQQLFYHFVWHGKMNRESEGESRNTNEVLMIGQDTIPTNNYSNCDLWFANDIVPRHGRVD